MWLTLLIPLMLWAADPQPTAPPTLLESHLELAQQDKVYLVLGSGQVGVFIRGIQVKTLPVDSQAGLLAGPAALSKVELLIPGLPRKVVVACSGCDDPSGGVGMDDRIGIEEMPGDFLAVLDDGTSWLVLSANGWSPADQLRSGYWEARGIVHFLRSLMVQGRGRFLVSRMQPDTARALYWALQPGMAVLRADQRWVERNALEEITMNTEQVLVALLMAASLISIWVLHRKGLPRRIRKFK